MFLPLIFVFFLPHYLHLLVIFVTGPSLHCLEGNSLECSIRLSSTHHPLFSDLHLSLPDGVHGPLLLFFFGVNTSSSKFDKIVRILFKVVESKLLPNYTILSENIMHLYSSVFH